MSTSFDLTVDHVVCVVFLADMVVREQILVDGGYSTIGIVGFFCLTLNLDDA